MLPADEGKGQKHPGATRKGGPMFRDYLTKIIDRKNLTQSEMSEMIRLVFSGGTVVGHGYAVKVHAAVFSTNRNS